MKKFEELSMNTQANILTGASFIKTIIGIIILSIGLSDIFLEDKGSFWSVLYVITGIVIVFLMRYGYKTFLELRKLERDLDMNKK